MAQYPPGALHWGPSPHPGESVGENVAGGARWEVVLPLTLSRCTYVCPLAGGSPSLAALRPRGVGDGDREGAR